MLVSTYQQFMCKNSWQLDQLQDPPKAPQKTPHQPNRWAQTKPSGFGLKIHKAINQRSIEKPPIIQYWLCCGILPLRIELGNFTKCCWRIRLRPKKVFDLYLGKFWVTLGRLLGQLFPKYYLTYCPKNKHLYNPYPPKGIPTFPFDCTKSNYETHMKLLADIKKNTCQPPKADEAVGSCLATTPGFLLLRTNSMAWGSRNRCMGLVGIVGFPDVQNHVLQSERLDHQDQSFGKGISRNQLRAKFWAKNMRKWYQI